MPTPTTSNAARERRDQLFLIFQPLLGLIVRDIGRILPSTLDRDDLTQIANVALLDASARFERYARTRVRGALINSARGPAYQNERCLRIDEFPEFATSPAEGLERLDLRRAIDKLPADEKKVIVMKTRGATTREIAAVSRVTTRTVKRRSASAIVQLKEHLAAAA